MATQRAGEPEDAALIRDALAGSEEAFARLLRRYERSVFGLVLRMVRDRAVAEELVQDTFLKAYRALASYDAERKFSSWLFAIAHNTSIDHLRRRSPVTVPLEDPEPGTGPIAWKPASGPADPERRALASALGRAFEEGLLELRPDYAEVLVLRYRECLSYEEIAAVTSLPLGTVKTHIHRARRALAAWLAARGWRPGGEGPGVG